MKKFVNFIEKNLSTMIIVLLCLGFLFAKNTVVAEEIKYQGHFGVDWRLTNDGILYLSKGEIEKSYIGENSFPWSKHKYLIKKIYFEGPIKESTYYSKLFQDLPELELITNLDYYDSKDLRDMSNMFLGSNKLENLDLSSWDVSNVENMNSMFVGLTNLKNVNLTNWNTNSLKHMNRMFSGLISLKELQINHLDVSNVTEMSYLFSGNRNLETLKLNNWDVSKVEKMDFMFSGNEKL